MHDLIREEGSFGANPGTKDLARHLYTRMLCGKVVIIADNPKVVLSSLRKQWLKLARKVQKERASTLKGTRVYELTDILTRMHTLQFTANYPPDDYPGDVHIITLEQALSWTPECQTLYVTCDIELEKLYIITAWMPKGGLVVTCKLAAGKVKPA